ncbi:MAG TPA: outer membrane protein assembly factor BamA [Thermoanaerobaculia bacterium]|nr:outer membrane protein assembly factor BamA [Thermoanaerobaculia bacterium]
MKIAALLLALMLSALSVRAQAPTAPEELLPIGPTVSAIEIRSEVQPDNPEELERLLSFQVGEPLTDEAVQSTLRNLQASGYASSVEVYVRPADRPGQIGNGVVVIVVLRPVERVQEVRIEGDLGLDRSELHRVLPQKEAEPLSEESVIQGVYNLLDLYSARGWFGATVRTRVDTDPQTDLSTVVYDVHSGVRSRVGDVRFDGNLGPVKPADLVKEIDQKPGQPFSRPAARDDAEDLQGFLVKEGYRTARVSAPGETPDPETHTVNLVFPVTVGPKVVVTVEGADADRLRRRGLLPFLEEEGYDEALVIQAVERIKRAWQEDGYYRVQVSYDEQRTEDLLKVVLRIVPGREYTLRSVSFAGNQTFGDDQLDELVKTAPRTLLAIGSGRLVDDDLDEDVKNLRRFYQLQGFSQVEVGPPQVYEKDGDLEVTLPIQEGPRMRVVNLKLEGLDDLDRDTVRAALQLKEGGPFHPYLLEQSLESLRAAFRDQGYAAAQVSAEQDWNPDHTLVDVTIQALPGLQTVLDRVIVRGNRRTRSEVIRRTMGADPGEPISERRALEIERDLYRLGIFSSVDVELTHAGLEESTRDLIVRVEEGRPRRVSYGLGFEYSSDETQERKWVPRGSLSFSHNNVAGRAYSLRSDLRLSTQDQIVRFRFDQPYTAHWALPVSYSLFYFNEEKQNWTVQRWGGRVETAKIYTDRRVGLALDYRIVETDLDPDFPERGVDREDRQYRLLDLVPSFLWDRRNDPVVATRGWSSLAQLQYSIPALGTDGDFLKLFLQQTQYFDLRTYGTIAMSLRAGGIEPFRHLENDDPELPETLPNSDIFIDERFFAGGATSHRAYGRDDLGIRGETLIPNLNDPDTFTSVGGNGLLLYNLEYRFPLFRSQTFGGTVFYDAGNVWADWRDIDPGGIKQGAGVGLRYLSPIGPLRVDIGWKLDRERGENPYAITVSFGNPF